MLAMIKLWKSEVLRASGWKLLLQIHDEVILEGPKESMEEVSSCELGRSECNGVESMGMGRELLSLV